MTENDSDIALLKATIALLGARLDELSEQHRRDFKLSMRWDDVLDKYRRVMDAELSDALERIAHLELTLFPHLPRAIRHLNDVIGDQDTKAYNPLDFRDPSKKSR
jgi:hypothetical protein